MASWPSGPRAGFNERWTVPVCLLCVLLMTVANLRGLKESGGLFAGPTYFYIIMLVLLIVTGLIRIFVFDLGPIPQRSPSRVRRWPT